MHYLCRCLGYASTSKYLTKYLLISVKQSQRHFNVTVNKWPVFSYKKSRINKSVSKSSYLSQNYDAFLVLDLEASFTRGFTVIEHKEIIELPCVWVDAATMDVVSIFHKYVRPVVNPILDTKVIELTGISECMLEDEKPFTDVLQEFKQWYEELKQLTNAKKIIFVTFGNWDLKKMMPEQCRISNVTMPVYMNRWIDIRCSVTEAVGKFPKSLNQALNLMEVKRIGRPHCGLDDTLSTVNILKSLAERGYVFH